MRRGELLGLKWDDVDLERGVLQVRRALTPDGKSFNQPKSAKGRRKIRLIPDAVEVLKGHKAAQNEERLRLGASWQDDGVVFCSRNGTLLPPSNFINRSYKLQHGSKLLTQRR